MSPLMDDMSDHHESAEKPQKMGAHDSQPEEHAEDLSLREHTLDLAAMGAKLRSKSGKQYWRSLEELGEDPHFEELLQREFPRLESGWGEGVERGELLEVMGGSLGDAGVGGGWVDMGCMDMLH